MPDRHKLSSLLINRVAFVDAGANQLANMVVVKHDAALADFAESLGGPLGERLKRALEKVRKADGMKDCPHCGKPVVAGAEKCPSCGKAIEKREPAKPVEKLDAWISNEQASFAPFTRHEAKVRVHDATTYVEVDPSGAKELLSEIGKRIADESVEKAGRKISATRLARLREAHEKLASVLAEVEALDEGGVNKAMTCPKCGASNPAGSKFCAQCGAKLEGPPAPTPTGKGGKVGDKDQVEKIELDETKLGNVSDEVKGYLKGLIDDANAKLEKAASEKPDPKPDDSDPIEKALKSEDANVRALAEVAKQAQADAKAAKDAADAEVAKREIAEEMGVLKGFGNLGLDVEKLAPELREMKRDKPTAYEETLKALKAANEQAKSGALLKEFGSSIGGPDTAIGQLEAAAAELQKADPKLTREAAFAKAAEQHPDLAEQYEVERKEANR